MSNLLGWVALIATVDAGSAFAVGEQRGSYRVVRRILTDRRACRRLFPSCELSAAGTCDVVTVLPRSLVIKCVAGNPEPSASRPA
jgi:hypothetical protein